MRIPVTLGGEIVGQAKINLQENQVYADIEITSELATALLKQKLVGDGSISVSYSLDDEQIHITQGGTDVRSDYPA